MHWFRSNHRLGAFTALFALVLQFALTLGHVHLVGVAPSAVKASFVATLDNQSSATAPDQDAAPVIPNKSPHRTASDFCAICSLIQLTGTMLPAARPPLPQPIVLGRALLGHGDQLALAPSHRGLWHARAPPLA